MMMLGISPPGSRTPRIGVTCRIGDFQTLKSHLPLVCVIWDKS